MECYTDQVKFIEHRHEAESFLECMMHCVQNETCSGFFFTDDGICTVQDRNFDYGSWCRVSDTVSGTKGYEEVAAVGS